MTNNAKMMLDTRTSRQDSRNNNHNHDGKSQYSNSETEASEEMTKRVLLAYNSNHVQHDGKMNECATRVASSSSGRTTNQRTLEAVLIA